MFYFEEFFDFIYIVYSLEVSAEHLISISSGIKKTFEKSG